MQALLQKKNYWFISGGDYNKSIEKSTGGKLLITAGAGDIDQLVEPIQKILLNKTL